MGVSAAPHRCAPPAREWPWRYLAPGARVPEFAVDGVYGDLWECGVCRRLWRVGDACPVCDRRGAADHDGEHWPGVMWRPARWWQRLLWRVSRLLRVEPWDRVDATR